MTAEMTLNLKYVGEDLDSGLAATLEDVLNEMFRAAELHFFPTDVIHAAAIVSEEAGELVRAANNVYYDDTIEHRENMLREAIQTAAMGLRFLLNAGNLKSKDWGP